MVPRLRGICADGKRVLSGLGCSLDWVELFIVRGSLARLFDCVSTILMSYCIYHRFMYYYCDFIVNDG